MKKTKKISFRLLSNIKNKISKKSCSKVVKRFLICGVAMVVVGILIVLSINLVMYFKCKDCILSVDEAAELDADCILVLGAGVRDDGSPTWMLEDRILVGIDAYNHGASPKIIMSGDHGREDYDEVNTMKQYAIDEGVPSEDIFMDHAGFSTYETMYRAKEIFGAEKVVIITQKYHLYRAIYDAKALGLEAYGISADLRTYSKMQYYREFREWIARAKDFVQVIFRPEPTYLGEAVDLSGSGDVTNDK